MKVRAEAVGDRTAVRTVHRAAFPHHGDAVANLVDELRDLVTRGDGLSLVAEERDEVVGHVMFSASLLNPPKRLVPVQVLSPIGVAPAWQNRGVGTRLIRRGLEVLAGRDEPLVFLEGPPAYYSRFGFLPALFPAYETRMTGTLVYSEPFWTHDLVGLRDRAPEA